MYKKNFFWLVVVLLLTTSQLFSQADTIEIRGKANPVFIMHGTKLSPKYLVEICKVNPEAYNIMLNAKKKHTISTILGVAGGTLVGFPLGYAIAGGEMKWELIGAGAGLIAISIPFSMAYKKQAKKAVILYNEGLKDTGMNTPNLNLGFSANGIGLTLVF